ncbi:MAG: four helix bundle protein [Bacteroidota bacterium]
MNYTNIESLETWKVARQLRMEISTMAKNLPAEEKYLLKNQIVRSSRSVAANIAEGFGRFHFQENIQYCRQARGSLIETLEHLICSYDEGYIDQTKLNELRQIINQCLFKINSYIKYLKTAKQGN